MDAVENKQLFQTPTNSIIKAEERTHPAVKKYQITKSIELKYNELE